MDDKLFAIIHVAHILNMQVFGDCVLTFLGVQEAHLPKLYEVDIIGIPLDFEKFIKMISLLYPTTVERHVEVISGFSSHALLKVANVHVTLKTKANDPIFTKDAIYLSPDGIKTLTNWYNSKYISSLTTVVTQHVQSQMIYPIDHSKDTIFSLNNSLTEWDYIEMSFPYIQKGWKIHSYFSFSISHTIEKNCSICKEENPTSTFVFKTPCNHTFHYDCLKKWIMNNETCPMCRSTHLISFS